MVRVLSVGLVVVAGAAVAGQAPDALAQARALMASASFEKALALADKALKTAKEPALRGGLELARAECFHALRNRAQMREALERALRADATAQLDAESANPELVTELQKLRKGLAG